MHEFDLVLYDMVSVVASEFWGEGIAEPINGDRLIALSQDHKVHTCAGAR